MIQNKIHTKDRPMKVHGQNNEITFLDENGKKIKKIKGLELTIIGNCNKVIINTPTDFTDFSVWIEGNCGTFIFEGSKNYIKNSMVKILDGGYVKIGQDTSMINKAFLCSKGGKIILGKDCMLASDVTIRDNDAHDIINKSGEITNHPQQVIIGDHVWIGMRAIILKNSEIGSDCIIGAGSVVVKKFPENNLMIAGNPAKVVKKGINWIR